MKCIANHDFMSWFIGQYSQSMVGIVSIGIYSSLFSTETAKEGWAIMAITNGLDYFYNKYYKKSKAKENT